MLRLDRVHASYGPIEVLFGIDLEVHDGEIVALLGTNGASKTTILRVISGVKHPALGDVVWNGESIKGLRPPDVLRRRIVQIADRDLPIDENAITVRLELCLYELQHLIIRLRADRSRLDMGGRLWGGAANLQLFALTGIAAISIGHLQYLRGMRVSTRVGFKTRFGTHATKNHSAAIPTVSFVSLRL